MPFLCIQTSKFPLSPIKNRELGIGIVAYSPLGRGFFGYGPKMVDDLEPEDFRRVYTFPSKVKSFTQKKDCHFYI